MFYTFFKNLKRLQKWYNESLEKNMKEFLDENHFFKIIDSINDGVIVTDKERKIVYINEKGRKLLRYKEGEILKVKCKSITQTSRCDEECPMTMAISQNRDIDNIDMWYTTKDGNKFLSRTKVLLLKNSAGELIGGVEIFRDITQVSQMQEEFESQYNFSNLIGKSGSMNQVFDLIKMVSNTDSTCLITGESGTGKELVANAIHYNSLRKEKPLVKVHCAALNEGVLESELFGHVKGAFTGANWDKVGRFEYASGGTLFLDEIGEIPPSTQVKLLRVVQEGELERVGSSKTIKIDVRLIAATNKNLEEEVRKGSFRQDLYYRLNVFKIALPPLRERKEDIPMLVNHFIKKVSSKMPQKQIEGIEAEALSRLMEYDYPGNVRELENIIEHSAIRARGKYIKASDLPLPLIPLQINSEMKLHQINVPLQNLERELIVKALDETRWRISKTASKLGVSRVTLWRKMKEYGIEKRD
jgi:PAS domain S-box-containing protein